MTSPTAPAPQFQVYAGPSNLDRCYRCGLPRSAHDADWSCPASKPGAPAILLVLGSLLALAGGAIWWVRGGAGGALAPTALFIGITMLVATATTIGRSG